MRVTYIGMYIYIERERERDLEKWFGCVMVEKWAGSILESLIM